MSDQQNIQQLLEDSFLEEIKNDSSIQSPYRFVIAFFEKDKNTPEPINITWCDSAHLPSVGDKVADVRLDYHTVEDIFYYKDRNNVFYPVVRCVKDNVNLYDKAL